MPNIKKDDEFILDIKRLGINGEGIGFYNKLAVFVKDAIPGEGHNVKVTKVDNKMAFAKSLELKTKVDYRKAAECPYYNKCGGCNVMHINNDKVLSFKRDLVIESLTRYTKINPRSFEIKDTLSLNELNYRNRSQLSVVEDEGEYKVAMIMEDSNIQIPIDSCLIQNELLNRINNSICALLKKYNISIYSYKKSGVIRYLSIRVNRKNEALVTLVCYENKDLIKLSEDILKIDGVVGVYKSTNKSLKSGTSIIGENVQLLCGKEFIIETLGNVKYKIYPDTFFQLNTMATEEMLKIVLKQAKLSFKERVLDAYSGVGAIGLYLAHNAKEVIGIENNKASVIAASENAELNKIKNAKFYQGDAGELLPKMVKDGEVFDVIVVDPPRTGLDDRFIDAILESNVKRIIYISCNPSTLAKNLDRLTAKYQVNSMIPLDMLPKTAHVEVVTTLTLKKVA
ncbi:MAG: 23S rRNA (uracil(1939)-C(5))-methyltransferase RlmD [Acholeplasmatales bacterium]|nr:23S rRNA (uracil(1939)-C(5))-methyltransferase RlmD [Acholeplasmatales bacterium]